MNSIKNFVKRPWIIILLTVFCFGYGLICLFSFLKILMDVAFHPDMLGILTTNMLIYLFICTVVLLGTGYYIFKKNKRGWWAVGTLSIYAILGSLWTLPTNLVLLPADMTKYLYQQIIVGLIIYSLLIFFLFQKNILEFFNIAIQPKEGLLRMLEFGLVLLLITIALQKLTGNFGMDTLTNMLSG